MRTARLFLPNTSRLAATLANVLLHDIGAHVLFAHNEPEIAKAGDADEVPVWAVFHHAAEARAG